MGALFTRGASLLLIAKIVAVFDFGHSGRACCLRGARRENSQRDSHAAEIEAK